MIIHVHSIVHNEERLLPFFLDHYRCAEKIFLYDNESNDRTVEIAEGSGAVVEPHPTGGYCRELANLHLKNNAWKLRSQQADWVVVCDADEFIFHPSLLEYLMACKSRGVTIPRPVGYDMVSEAFPISGQPIIKQVRRGKFFKNFSKPAIFDPKKIVEMNYSPGCHKAKPEGEVVFDDDPDLKLLHMAFLGVDWIRWRWGRNDARRSPEDVASKHSWHAAWYAENAEQIHRDSLRLSEDVI